MPYFSRRTMIKNSIAILFLFALSVYFPLIATQAKPIEAATVAVTVTPAPAHHEGMVPTVSRVEYVLPYPGILPTHPLYVFKKIRDSIIEMIISDPLKKAEFYMLQADKKLNMAIFLFDKKNPTVATEQLAQSQSIRELAVVQLETLIAEGKAVPPFVPEKLSTSIQKHIEVETGYKRGVESLQALLVRSQKLVKTDSTKVINN